MAPCCGIEPVQQRPWTHDAQHRRRPVGAATAADGSATAWSAMPPQGSGLAQQQTSGR